MLTELADPESFGLRIRDFLGLSDSIKYVRLLGLLSGAAVAVALVTAQGTLTNPVLSTGPDPWVIRHDGVYYYTNTTGSNLTLWKTRSIAELATATHKVVWTPPASGPYSQQIWAPELHFLRGSWYLYFAADDGSNKKHRIWVLENKSADPLKGEWTLKGKLSDPGDHWAIDASVFENGGRLYLIWSGWEGATNEAQNIYLAELSDPWTMKGDRVKVSSPTYPWEKAGDIKVTLHGNETPASTSHEPIHLDVNEGPEMLKHGDRLFLVYSASACWTDWYELGMLTARSEANLLNPASWVKDRLPVFWESPDAGAFGTGHNGFFQSPDGKEDWIIYHANAHSGDGCGGGRSPRAQPIHWKADGTPDFGRPVPVGQPIPRPSGE
jgi:GH43 family beta-xylosidase